MTKIRFSIDMQLISTWNTTTCKTHTHTFDDCLRDNRGKSSCFSFTFTTQPIRTIPRISQKQHRCCVNTCTDSVLVCVVIPFFFLLSRKTEMIKGFAMHCHLVLTWSCREYPSSNIERTEFRWKLSISPENLLICLHYCHLLFVKFFGGLFFCWYFNGNFPNDVCRLFFESNWNSIVLERQ